MNVFFEPLPHSDSRGVRRIYDALGRFIPSGVFESSYEASDLVVFYACGRRDHLRILIDKLGSKKYAIIQVALASTRNPNPRDWEYIWHKAKVVWSYYDLPLADYYHAPLAADPRIFHLEIDRERKFLIMTNGCTTRDESLAEIEEASARVGGIILHADNVTDDSMRAMYNQSKFVNALRRKDGFEMPAIEGLLCGARPVMYDNRNYRQWFDGLAEFIPEEDSDKVVDNLEKLFLKEYTPVSVSERLETLHRFDWKTIARGFWERIV